MRLLVDIGHPGHVHLFRNAIQKWKEDGHRVFITIRERDIVSTLLKAYGLDYTVASTAKSGKVRLMMELLQHDWNVYRNAVKYKVDFMLGTSLSITHTSRLTGIKSIVFNEDDADYLPSFRYLAYPFADYIVIPECLRDRRTSHYITYNSLHELAYLHPDHFTPDPQIYTELGLQTGEKFFIIRLVAFKAHHDSGHAGLNLEMRRKLIQLLQKKGKVFLTVEGAIPDEFKPFQIPIPPHRIHHALAFTNLLVSDSQTMTIEAAVLGTPTVRYNTFVGMCSVINELEDKYQLALGFRPGQEAEMVAAVQNMTEDLHLGQSWQTRRQTLLQEKINLSKWMVNLLETLGRGELK